MVSGFPARRPIAVERNSDPPMVSAFPGPSNPPWMSWSPDRPILLHIQERGGRGGCLKPLLLIPGVEPEQPQPSSFVLILTGQPFLRPCWGRSVGGFRNYGPTIITTSFSETPGINPNAFWTLRGHWGMRVDRISSTGWRLSTTTSLTFFHSEEG